MASPPSCRRSRYGCLVQTRQRERQRDHHISLQNKEGAYFKDHRERETWVIRLVHRERGFITNTTTIWIEAYGSGIELGLLCIYYVEYDLKI
jgi:hypothetical protein